MMSGNELQYGLIGLSVIAILALVIYNLWQERRARKTAEQAFRSTHHDVLLDGDAEAVIPPAPGGRMEPGLQRDIPSAASRGSDTPAMAARASVLPRQQEPSLPWELQAIDCAVSIEAPAGVSASALYTAQQEALSGNQRNLAWFGWNDNDNEWFEIDARTPGSINRACVTLQLADRRGALTEKELDRFNERLARVCDQFLAVPRLPAKADTLARAHEIDQFSSEVDIQIAVNVVSAAAPFAGTKIRGLAEAAGLQLGNDGCYHALDDAGLGQFVLANQENTLFSVEQLKHLQTPGLTLVLDVPRALNPASTFERMVRLAQHLADSLGGVLVDDNRNPLTERSIQLIRSQIGQFELQMERQSMPAGSLIALRLFS
ncbi:MULTISPECIES: cell division protein ZipA C-terminal FtsZ-binding domain-containing protein [unclassified Uliginosibacterium]|uniref:cell division protein ZipA C-terminal FtsZ-binding domain-containing protein n=1 Tax=unclassified Uliginosibacterium TaxID=2621521 RepID=UPI000C7DDF2A|nr:MULTISPECIES: cell division protein ZipA C-terminal FtsZ-binding domain-containing protein [unclassified Uliginosibacterium]MDO6385446.1 cell division protein ZipA C-terminal FtsZ-binding domain-containing protein [Uliginosibacterium sp. 31-12]PLK47493.1 ZipA [Uliginosibacterium sp. TH139]